MYTLHKLPEGFIVTSNEEPFNTDLCLYSNQEIMPFDGGLGEIWNYELCKKLIAKQDQIDFSALSEEEQKEIGLFTQIIRNKAFEHANKHDKENCGHRLIIAYIEGFQKSQELLSDKRFTLDEVKRLLFQVGNAMRYKGINYASYYNYKNVKEEVDKVIQSLSQPKSWKVIGNWENDKFKITKIL